MFKFENGVEVKDKVTGFTGKITGRVEYLTGCNQYIVQPPIKNDGEFTSGIWLDEHRLEQIGTAKIVLDEAKTKGAGEPAPIK